MENIDRIAPAKNDKRSDKIGPVIAASYMLFAGSIIFNLLPIFLGSVATKFGLTTEQIGFTGSLSILGFGVASVSAPIWIRSVKRSIVCQWSLLTSALALGLAAFAANHTMLLACLVVSGFAGGATFACGLDAIGATHNKERNFALSILVIQAISAVLLLIVAAQTEISFQMLTIIIATLVMAGAGLGRFVSDTSFTDNIDEKVSAPITGISYVLPLVSLISLAVFGVGIVGIWAFLERIAANAGVLSGDIAFVLAQGYIAGAVGALAASLLASRAGVSLPIIVSSLILTSLLFVAPGLISAGLFLFVVVVFQAVWNFVLSYQFVVISDVDQSKRLLAAAPAFQAIGAVLGPTIIGILSSESSFSIALTVGAIAVLVSGCLFVGVYQVAFRTRPSPMP